jgi:trans-aconitate methyltransferase
VSETLEFIDFGAGKGQSFDFAATCAPGPGLAIDKSEDAVLQCHQKGINAELADVLDFDRRNLAASAFAINLLPEMPGQAAFRQALVNIVRSATQFAVIQHPFFDKDGDLALKGLQIADHFDKRVLYKPTMADYVNFLSTYKDALAISGFAICTSGQVVATPIPHVPSNADETRAAKTIRVIIGRKSTSRFRRAMFRAQTGKTVFQWEGE